jgi:hypothetical protein
MNQDGVGCESCHGAAENWLALHTTDRWKRISPADKQKNHGFTYTKNLVRRIEVCAGCHVGQDDENGFPVRDVNHDLIAAGHPRLYFEFAAYQENQPTHWRTDKPAVEADADFPARAWALGQLVSAKTALDLLVSRSAHAPVKSPPGLPPALPDRKPQSPWPEFAEYGCFSCHHGLADEPWRGNRATIGVSPGAPAWGSWSYPLTSALLENCTIGDHANVKEFQSALKSLTEEMSRPAPDSATVKRIADNGIEAVEALIRDFSIRPPFNAAVVEQLIDGLNRREAWKEVASWDHAAQRYLALVPLNQARGLLDPRRVDKQQALSSDLHAILKCLRFPDGFDSPRGFDPGRLPVGP